MSPRGAWCLILIMSFANGEMEQPSCTGESCEVSDSTVLLQSALNVAEAAETASEGVAEAPGDGDKSGNTDVDCGSFTRGSTCRSSGCSWSGAFEGEKKEDGSALSGYICADEEEVEEEVHDKLMNGTGSLIQMLEDESEITSEGNEERYCRRRRLSRRRGVPAGRRSGGCPYARRRRTVSNPTKVEANGCPAGYQLNKNYAKNCPGGGHCCTTSFKPNCNNMCAYQKCSTTGGKWISSKYPYTCEMPKPPSKPSKYCDEPNADNAGFDCLCEQAADNAQQEPFCGLTKTWSGTLAVAKAKCDANADCKFLHDWKADGQHWRACRTINSPGDGKAAIKKKSSTGTCANLSKGPAQAACWVRMPTGCSKALTETKTPKSWFKDPLSPTSGKCSSRKAAFNAHCGRSDAMNSWGSEPQPPPAPIAAPTTTLFDRMDADKNGIVSFEEFNKALDACTISAPGFPCAKKAVPSLPPATTAAPSKGPAACWVRMPTGCSRRLSETSSPKSWFKDPLSPNSGKCTSRKAAFNAHCRRSDAMNSWGSEPQASTSPSPSTTAAPTTTAPAATSALTTAAPTAAPKPGPTPAPTRAADPLFNDVDKNNNNAITKSEFNKAVAAGTIIVKAP